MMDADTAFGLPCIIHLAIALVSEHAHIPDFSITSKFDLVVLLTLYSSSSGKIRGVQLALETAAAGATTQGDRSSNLGTAVATVVAGSCKRQVRVDVALPFAAVPKHMDMQVRDCSRCHTAVVWIVCVQLVERSHQGIGSLLHLPAVDV